MIDLKGGPMARIVQLEKNVFVASQLTEADFAEIAARGIRSVVNNRPDGEADDQLHSTQAEAAARRHGLAFHHAPVTNYDVTEDAPVDTQTRLIADLPGPILFYCRTGNRSSILWAQASAARLGAETVLDRAAAAGFDLAELREFIDDRAGALAA
jgi:sulfide:quinone oxidoreductase